MARREAPEVNSGSMADIAFMLLIFFLVATTMDVDSGISRVLPPINDDPIENQKEVKERNVFVVLVNSNNKLLVEGSPLDISNLREKAKEFIANPNDLETLPEKKDPTTVDFFGSVRISKQVISLQNDRGTSYETYIKVQNELAAAYNELRDELSLQKFGKVYGELSKDKQKAVKKIFPQRISEAEPKNVGGAE